LHETEKKRTYVIQAAGITDERLAEIKAALPDLDFDCFPSERVNPRSRWKHTGRFELDDMEGTKAIVKMIQRWADVHGDARIFGVSDRTPLPLWAQILKSRMDHLEKRCSCGARPRLGRR
jgi:signal recognition particle subunit SEC65